MGHTKVRCKAPPKEDAGGDSAVGGATFDAPATAAGDDEWNTGGNAGGDAWETAQPAAATTSAGGW